MNETASLLAEVVDLEALRVRTRAYAAGFGFGSAKCGDVTLVVNELATNGLAHGKAPVEVCLDAFGDLMRVSVWDSLVVAVPLCGEPDGVDEEAEGGRGLLCVREFADVVSWGLRGCRKFVRAEFELRGGVEGVDALVMSVVPGRDVAASGVGAS